VSASVNLPLHHKVQKFSSGTGSRGWSQKKGHKMVVFIGPLPTFPENYMQIRLDVSAQSYQQTDNDDYISSLA